MAILSTNKLRSGINFILHGEPCYVIENKLVKLGKGQAFARVRYRNLRTGRVNEQTFKSGASVESANLIEMELEYCYADGELWYFMDPVTFEQYGAAPSVIADCKNWLKEQYTYKLTQWNGEPLLVVAPNFVNLTVTETEPGLRGDTSGGGSKSATLETGAVVRVPLFIKIGELLRIDTRRSEYVERAKVE